MPTHVESAKTGIAQGLKNKGDVKEFIKNH